MICRRERSSAGSSGARGGRRDAQSPLTPLSSRSLMPRLLLTSSSSLSPSASSSGVPIRVLPARRTSCPPTDAMRSCRCVRAGSVMNSRSWFDLARRASADARSGWLCEGEQGQGQLEPGRAAGEGRGTHRVRVVVQAVGPDEVEVLGKRLLGAVRLLLDLLEQRREVHRALDDCARTSSQPASCRGYGESENETHHRSSRARRPCGPSGGRGPSAPADKVERRQPGFLRRTDALKLTVVLRISLTMRSSVSWKSLAADLSSCLADGGRREKGHRGQPPLIRLGHRGERGRTTASEASMMRRLSSSGLRW